MITAKALNKDFVLPIFTITLFTVVAINFPGCSSDGNNDKTTGTDSDTSGGDSDTVLKYVCDEQAFFLEPELGRLMILQDMSSSMQNPGSVSDTKWEDAKIAIANLMDKYKNKDIKFGFDTFPDGSEDGEGELRCGVTNDVANDTKLDNEETIKSNLNNFTPVGDYKTPLYCAMNNFTDEQYAPNFTEGDENKVLIIVSDGGDNCGSECIHGNMLSFSDFTDLTEKLKNDMGIKTMAIGFGTDYTTEMILDDITKFGGTGFTAMIPADDPDELERALGLATGLVVGCVFKVNPSNQSADPTEVNFYFDDELVKFDDECQHGTGWFWSNEFSEVTFCEDACMDLQTTVKVSVKYGCATVIL